MKSNIYSGCGKDKAVITWRGVVVCILFITLTSMILIFPYGVMDVILFLAFLYVSTLFGFVAKKTVLHKNVPIVQVILLTTVLNFLLCMMPFVYKEDYSAVSILGTGFIFVYLCTLIVWFLVPFLRYRIMYLYMSTVLTFIAMNAFFVPGNALMYTKEGVLFVEHGRFVSSPFVHKKPFFKTPEKTGTLHIYNIPSEWEVGVLYMVQDYAQIPENEIMRLKQILAYKLTVPEFVWLSDNPRKSLEHFLASTFPSFTFEVQMVQIIKKVW